MGVDGWGALLALLAVCLPIPPRAWCESIDAASSGDPVFHSLNIAFTGGNYAGCSDPTFDDANWSCETISTSVVHPWDSFCWILVGGVAPYDAQTDTGGIGGVQFGIDLDPGVSLNWALCNGGAEIPQNDQNGTRPESGTGNAVSWPNGCYPDPQNSDGLARVGFFWHQGPGVIRITEDPRVAQALVWDCAVRMHDVCPELFGAGDFEEGGRGGRFVCGGACAVPVEASSWSRVKAAFQ